jgi:hypothetical protein
VLGQFAALKAEIGLTERYRIEDRRAGQEIEDSTTPFRRTKEEPAHVCHRIRWTVGVAHRLPARRERQSNRTRKATAHACEVNRQFWCKSCDAIPTAVRF